MNPLLSLLSIFLCSTKSFQMSSECTFHRFTVFKSISVIIPNCFKYRQKAPFTLNSQNFNSFQILYEYTLHLVFDLSLKFQNGISKSVRMYHFTVHGININRWDRPPTSHPSPLTQNPGPLYIYILHYYNAL